MVLTSEGCKCQELDKSTIFVESQFKKVQLLVVRRADYYYFFFFFFFFPPETETTFGLGHPFQKLNHIPPSSRFTVTKNVDM